MALINESVAKKQGQQIKVLVVRRFSQQFRPLMNELELKTAVEQIQARHNKQVKEQDFVHKIEMKNLRSPKTARSKKPTSQALRSARKQKSSNVKNLTTSSLHSEVSIPQMPDDLKDDVPVKDINQASNVAEFLLLSLQKSFGYEPRQVQGLLTNRQTNLIEICKKGFDGDFGQIIHWVNTLASLECFQQLDKLIETAAKHANWVEVTLILSALKCGFYSVNAQVVMQSLFVMTQLVSILKKYPSGFEHMQNWFVKIYNYKDNQTAPNFRFKVEKDSVLQLVIEQVVETHPQLLDHAAKLLVNVFQQPGIEIQMLGKICEAVFQEDVFLLYDGLDSFLALLHAQQPNKVSEMLTNGSGSISVLQRALKEGAGDEDMAVKVAASAFVFEVCHIFPNMLSNDDQKGVENLSFKDSTFALFKSAFGERHKVFRIFSLASSFSLLNCLIAAQNKVAPQLYKLLVHATLDLYRHPKGKNSILTDFLLQNFKVLFKTDPTIPIQVLVQPFVQFHLEKLKEFFEQINSRPSPLFSPRGVPRFNSPEQRKTKIQQQMLFAACEVKFLAGICAHEKLTADNAEKILELLGKVYLYHPQKMLCTLAWPSIQLLIKKFGNEAGIQYHIKTVLIEGSFALFLQLRVEEKEQNAESVNMLTEKRIQSLKQMNNSKSREKEATANRKISRFNIVTLLEKLHAESVYKSILEQKLLESCKTYKEAHSKLGAGLNHLLNAWKQFDVFNSQMMVLQQALVPVPTEGSSSLRIHLREIEPISARKHTRRLSEQLDPIALRAVETIQKVKQNRIEKQNKERIEELKRQQKSLRLEQAAKNEVAKRVIVLERESLIRKQKVKAILSGETLNQNQPNSPFHPYLIQSPQAYFQVVSKKFNFQFQLEQDRQGQNTSTLKQYYLSQQQEKKKQFLTQGLVLVDFNEEEDRDVHSISLMLNKLHPAFKIIFDRYTQSVEDPDAQCRSNNPEQYLNSESTLNFVDLTKIFKDFGLDSLMTKAEQMGLLKMVNDSLLTRHSGDRTDFTGFVQYLAQTAIYCFAKGRLKPDAKWYYTNHQKELQLKSVNTLMQAQLYDLRDIEAGQRRRLQKKITQALQILNIKSEQEEIPEVQPTVIDVSFGSMLEFLADFIHKKAIKKNLNGLPMYKQIMEERAEVSNESTSEEHNNLALINKQLLTVPTLPLPPQYVIHKEIIQQTKYLVPAPLAKMMKPSKVIVIEVLDQFVAETLGFHFLESQKALVEVSKAQPRVLQMQAYLPTVNRRGLTKQISGSKNDLETQHPAHNLGDPSSLQRSYTTEYGLQMYSQANLIKMQKQKKVYTKTQGQESQPGPQKVKQMRENEQLLMNSHLTKDLKVACYDLQMARATEAVETIREAAFCLEDMLQAVCSEKKYRFSFNPTPATASFGHRMPSGKPASIAIKYQEPLTQTKARQLELKRLEEEKLERNKKITDLRRIKRNIDIKSTRNQSPVANDASLNHKVPPIESEEKFDHLTIDELDKKLAEVRKRNLSLRRNTERAVVPDVTIEPAPEEVKEKQPIDPRKKAILNRNKERIRIQSEKNQLIKRSSSSRTGQKVSQKKTNEIEKDEWTEWLIQATTMQVIKQRQEVLDFYLRDDVQQLFNQREVILRSLFSEFAQPKSRQDLDMIRMKWSQYANTISQCLPLLDQENVRVVFKTLIRERSAEAVEEEVGPDFTFNKNRPVSFTSFFKTNQTLSFEEFKKSLLRLTMLIDQRLSNQQTLTSFQIGELSPYHVGIVLQHFGQNVPEQTFRQQWVLGDATNYVDEVLRVSPLLNEMSPKSASGFSDYKESQ